jgi:hypothetical protein
MSRSPGRRALAKAYAEGDEGLEGEYGVYAHIGERTWQRLLEYKRGALVEERGTGEYVDYRQVRRMHITTNGRALYIDEWSRYREIFPEVEATEPVPQLVHGQPPRTSCGQKQGRV